MPSRRGPVAGSGRSGVGRAVEGGGCPDRVASAARDRSIRARRRGIRSCRTPSAAYRPGQRRPPLPRAGRLRGGLRSAHCDARVGDLQRDPSRHLAGCADSVRAGRWRAPGRSRSGRRRGRGRCVEGDFWTGRAVSSQPTGSSRGPVPVQHWTRTPVVVARFCLVWLERRLDGRGRGGHRTAGPSCPLVEPGAPQTFPCRDCWVMKGRSKDVD